MKVRYTRHAKRQMKWRRITEEEVVSVLKEPQRVEASVKDRFNAFKVLRGRLLKVTFYREKDILTVVTAIVRKG